MNSAPSMAFRVDLTERAISDLRRLYQVIDAEGSRQARDWFNGLERRILSLDDHPARAPTISEQPTLHHLLYRRKRNVYRIVFAIDDEAQVVKVLHIRHSARGVVNSHPEDD